MPTFKTRGIMLDLAREMETQAYYNWLLPWLKEWGYNTLHMHITDDQGCALQFPSHPQFASKGAYTADEMRAFIKTARTLGIEVIPEIESLGHTCYITHSAGYRHLGNDCIDKHTFNAMDPEHPDTQKVLTELLKDTARIFDSDILHVGLDEVDFSVLPKFKGKKRSECWNVFSKHAAWVHEAVRRVGKRPAMWGDHVLMTPEMAADFKRDVLMFDWHYEPNFKPASLEFFCKEKFEVWGCPSTMSAMSQTLSHESALSNLREFTAHALSFRRKGLSGMMNTVWFASRYLSGAMDWPMALAGHLFSTDKEDPAFCAEFCRSFYGLNSGDARSMAALLKAVHKAVPLALRQNLTLTNTGRPAPFTSEHARQCGEVVADFIPLIKALKPMVRKASRNAERLNDVLLSAQLTKRLGEFGVANRKIKSLPADSALRKAFCKSWDKVRVVPASKNTRIAANDIATMVHKIT